MSMTLDIGPYGVLLLDGKEVTSLPIRLPFIGDEINPKRYEYGQSTRGQNWHYTVPMEYKELLVEWNDRPDMLDAFDTLIFHKEGTRVQVREVHADASLPYRTWNGYISATKRFLERQMFSNVMAQAVIEPSGALITETTKEVTCL